MGKNRNFERMRRQERAYRHEPEAITQTRTTDLKMFETALEVDKLFARMKRDNLSAAKAKCPACGLRANLVLRYSGPRAASAYCINPECNFSLRA